MNAVRRVGHELAAFYRWHRPRPRRIAQRPWWTYETIDARHVHQIADEIRKTRQAIEEFLDRQ